MSNHRIVLGLDKICHLRIPNTDDFKPNTFYHCYNHAVGNENLFRSKDNYIYFLSKLKLHLLPVAKCYAYCLMPNHFHFLIQIRGEESLVTFQENYNPGFITAEVNYHKIVMTQISRILNGYAQAYNKRYERRGALFLDYTRRKEVATIAYLQNLIHYIHRNPEHHNFCSDFRDWEFSSYKSISSTKPTNIDRESILSLFGTKDNFENYHLSHPVLGMLQEFEL